MEEGDFGKRQGGDYEDDTSEYEVSYLSDLEVGDVFEGEIYMSKIRESEKSEEPFFNVVITNHDQEDKWVITFWKPTMVEEGRDMYGRKGGRVYVLVDSLLSAMFKDHKEDTEKYQTVEFEKFREGINNLVKTAKVEIVENPSKLTDKGTLRVVSVEEV